MEVTKSSLGYSAETETDDRKLPQGGSGTAPARTERPTDPPAEPPIGWADALGPDVENPPQARTHGRQLTEPDGTTHVVSSCEQRIKGQFELWVENNTLASIARVEAAGDLERADKMMSAYNGDHGAGHYMWDGKYVRRARFESLPGIKHLLYLLMVRCDPTKTEKQVSDLMNKYPKQCGELMAWALGNSQPPAKAGAKSSNHKTKTKTPSQD